MAAKAFWHFPSPELCCWCLYSTWERVGLGSVGEAVDVGIMRLVASSSWCNRRLIAARGR
jgi:hypothetical protein